VIQNKSVLAIIPARGGSKGVPHKNIRLIGGKPLIFWTIEAASKSKYIDRTIISTDDFAIADAARQCGGDIPFMRPANLAQDDTPGIAPVLHVLSELTTKYDLVVLLQPTSPLRTVEDIDGCIEQHQLTKSKSCVSVAEPDKSPYWMYQINDEKCLDPLFDSKFDRRQDMPKVYALNGAVYVAECEWLKSTKSFLSDETSAYVMSKEHSLDIDTELDLRICTFLLTEAN
jgi:N-acylneuraminate cytidylyltransferase